MSEWVEKPFSWNSSSSNCILNEAEINANLRKTVKVLHTYTQEKSLIDDIAKEINCR